MAKDAARSTLVQKLGRMAEIARVIDLNRADGEFCRIEGGSLIYVFDTNVFQLFLEAAPFSRFVEIFNTEVWSGPRVDRVVNRQSAIITSEHLFSGALPGAQHNSIIVSSWHYEELFEQMAYLYRRIRNTASADGAAEAIEAGVQRLHALARLVETRDEKLFDAARKGFTKTQIADDRRLEREGATIASRIDSYAVGAIAQLLAEDRYTEPQEQFVRMSNCAFKSHSLHPELYVDDERLAEGAKEWGRLIREADAAVKRRESARRRIREDEHSEYRPRSKEARERDAKTLAWLDYLAVNVIQPNQRLIFVTGDRLLLNASRRRKADHPDLPFLVRSTVHFAPLLNFNDARSQLKRGGRPRVDHFARMRQALEQSLAFLSLSMSGSGKNSAANSAKLSNRDRFIVDSEECDGDIFGAPDSAARGIHIQLFERFFQENWVTAKDRELQEVAKPIQSLERISIGAYRDKIMARIQDQTALKAFEQWASSEVPENLGDAMERAMNGLLQKVDSAARTFAVNWAPEFIITLIGETSRSYERAVYHLRIDFPVGAKKAESIDPYLRRLTENGGEGARTVLAKLKDTTRLFVLATAFGFRHERWTVAANYAALAADAADADPHGDDLLRGECHYLKATALRYRLASVAPNPDTASDDRWTRWLKASEDSHNLCLAIYRTDANPVRRARTLSERAAAKLAYVEWAAYGKLQEIRANTIDARRFRLRLEGLFQDAISDLQECGRALEEFRTSAKVAPERLENADRVLDHARWNGVVAKVVERRLRELKILAKDTTETLDIPPRLSEPPGDDIGPIYDLYRALLVRDFTRDTRERIRRFSLDDATLALDRSVAGYYLSLTS